jgi:hypothetical protein
VISKSLDHGGVMTMMLIDAAKTDGLSSRLVCASCEWPDRSVMPNMVVFHNDIGVFVAI